MKIKTEVLLGDVNAVNIRFIGMEMDTTVTLFKEEVIDLVVALRNDLAVIRKEKNKIVTGDE